VLEKLALNDTFKVPVKGTKNINIKISIKIASYTLNKHNQR